MKAQRRFPAVAVAARRSPQTRQLRQFREAALLDTLTISIRDASLADAATIAMLGGRFHAEAGWGDIAEYVTDDCEQTIRHLIENDDGICLVAEEDGRIVGMAGGLAHPFYFNHGHKTGMELFWWVDPDSRNGVGGKLLDELEAAARKRGCVSWGMIAVDKLHPVLMARIYSRRGYRASEHSWIKRL